VSLEEGLARTLDFFREKIKNAGTW
jgi:hypothetical protein